MSTFSPKGWEHDQQVATTDFSKEQDEIDARLAADAPEHPDSIELRRILQQSERASEVATAMLLILEMCLPLDGVIAPATPKQIGHKALTLLWLLQSSRCGIGDVGMADLARKIKVSRALLSHYARYWNKATGLRARGQKKATSSSSYRASAAKGWNTRRGVSADDAMEHTTDTVEASIQFSTGDDTDEDLVLDEIVPTWERGRGESYGEGEQE
jgi:hypothetical protein